ncbi:MAG: lipoyl(octanoyl) transferase LipB [Deltaproteobacteria bacterium]|nr:lipoyl(octanoyl) transferase LipB [Deltaproteobacteria bacterium]
MREPLTWQWLGLCTYDDALSRQERAWETCRNDGSEVCFALEHPATITLGRRGTREDVRVAATDLRARGIVCRDTERGGRATYHAPGQLVLYPIAHLARRGWSVARFVTLLEDVMADIAAVVGVPTHRDARGRGIWTRNGKLGSVGIRIRDGVSTHGLALNVDVDLSGFDLIAPCGMTDVHMTSLRAEGASANVLDLVPVAERALHERFDPIAEPACEVSL